MCFHDGNTGHYGVYCEDGSGYWQHDIGSQVLDRENARNLCTGVMM